MERLIPYLMCALFIALMYGVMRFFLWLSFIRARRAVYQSGVYTSKTVHTLFLTQVPAKYLISQKAFPRKTKDGVEYEVCDHLLLLRGALVLVTVCRGNGIVQNHAEDGMWTMKMRTKDGTGTASFPDPILKGKQKKEALISVLRSETCKFPVPIEHIVIFPSREVRFAEPRQDEIKSPPEAMRRLAELHKTKKFSDEQLKLLLRMLKRHAKKPSQVMAKNTKPRQR